MEGLPQVGMAMVVAMVVMVMMELMVMVIMVMAMVQAAKIPELVQYFSTVGTIKMDRTTKRPRCLTSHTT